MFFEFYLHSLLGEFLKLDMIWARVWRSSYHIFWTVFMKEARPSFKGVILGFYEKIDEEDKTDNFLLFFLVFYAS